MDNKSFKQFIDDSNGQKELSLILAKSIDEYHDFTNNLDSQGFVGSDDVYAVLSHPDRDKKAYLVINDKSKKVLYDFAMQYPTGQINLLDPTDMKNMSFNPDYENHSLLLLTTTDYLKYIAKDNLDFLDITGIVYRS